MKKRTLKVFWLGLFILLTLATLSWLLLFLRPSYGDGKQKIHVRFTNIEKVEVGTRVTYAGKAVGKVEAIQQVFEARTQPTNSHGDFYFYELILGVDSSVKLYTYDEIVFSTTGLLGEKSIAIIPRLAPPGEPAARELAPGEPLYAQSGDSIDATLQQFSNTAKSLETTLSKLNHYLEDSDQQLEKTMVAIQNAGDNLGTFFAIANKHDLAPKLASVANTLEVTATKANLVLDQAIDTKLIRNLGTMSQNLEKITTDIQSGNNTIGRLLQDDELYWQLSNLICHARETFQSINCYGILFQFNRKWRKERMQKLQQIQCMQQSSCKKD